MTGNFGQQSTAIVGYYFTAHGSKAISSCHPLFKRLMAAFLHMEQILIPINIASRNSISVYLKSVSGH